jgi:hypothetical protein
VYFFFAADQEEIGRKLTQKARIYRYAAMIFLKSMFSPCPCASVVEVF